MGDGDQIIDDEHLHNPADLPLVTLDNNVLIALYRDEPAAPDMRELLALNRAGLIAINVTLSTALEAPGPEGRLEWQKHIARLESLGIARGNIFTGPRTIGFMTPDAPGTVTFDPRLEIAFTERIHSILFPRMPFRWFEYRDRECKRCHLTETRKQALEELDALRLGFYFPATPQSPRQRPTPVLDTLRSGEREELDMLLQRLHRRWMNAKNDALGLHNHITSAWHTTHPEHSVFVTSDGNFTKPGKLRDLRAIGFRGEILPPAEAVAFLRSVIVSAIV